MNKFYKDFYRELGLEIPKTLPYPKEDFIFTDIFMVALSDTSIGKKKIISHLYIIPERRNEGLCGEIIKELTKTAGIYYVEIPVSSRSSLREGEKDFVKGKEREKYLKKKFESYGFKFTDSSRNKLHEEKGILVRKYTYFISSYFSPNSEKNTNNFDKSALIKLMDKDFIRVMPFTKYTKHIDIVILESPYDQYIKIDCQLRNHISDINIIANKSNLYLALSEADSSFSFENRFSKEKNKFSFPKRDSESYKENIMPYTIVIKPHTKIIEVDLDKLKYPVIVKGTDDWCNSGASNQVCLTKEEVMNYLFNKPGTEFVIQEYIIDVGLFTPPLNETSFVKNETGFVSSQNKFCEGGLKYHLRMFWMVKFPASPQKTLWRKKDKIGFSETCFGKTNYEPWRLMRRYRLSTGKYEYKKNNFLDKDIHDTHFYLSEAEYTDLDLPPKLSESFYNQACNICAKIYEVIKDMKEERDIYYVFGLDLLPTADNKLLLLECNTFVGLGSKAGDKNAHILSTAYYTELYEFIIKPYFRL